MLCRYVAKRPAHFVNVFPYLAAGRFDPRTINFGEVVEIQPGYGLGGVKRGDFDTMPDPRERLIPKQLGHLRAECDALNFWVQSTHLPWSARPKPFVDAARIVSSRLAQLIAPAVGLGMTADEIPNIGNVSATIARAVLNKLELWATVAIENCEQNTTPRIKRPKKRAKGRRTNKSLAPIPSSPRLTVDLARRTLSIKGKTFDVEGYRALRWVKVLASHPG